MSQNISQDKVKLNLARIKKFGSTFEISVDPDKALQYRKGEITDLREVLTADNIFSDAKKGQVSSESELEKAFQTTDTNKIADIILKQGEVQLSSEHRSEEREQKRKKLIHLINQQVIDAKTDLPIPPSRIEAALEEAKVNLVDHKTIEEQFDEIISRLRPILPIKIEQKLLLIKIPGQYAGKCQQPIRAYKILNEDWKADGSWEVKIELPAGMVQDFIDKMNSLTHGEVVVEIN